MSGLKEGDRVWVQVEVVRVRGEDVQVLADEKTNGTGTAIVGWVAISDCRSSPEPITNETKAKDLAGRWLDSVWKVRDSMSKGTSNE